MNGRCGIWRLRWRGSQGKAAHAAELAAHAIVMSACMAGIERGRSSVERGVLGGGFGIGFHGEALHGLKSRGNGFLIGFWSPHFRIKTLVDLAQSGIVRAYAGHRIFGILRRRGTGWPG